MNNIQSLSDLLLIDIETIPQQYTYNELTPEIRQLFFDKISKTMPENFDPEEGYKKRAGILAEFGKVICISTGFFYTEPDGKVCLKIKSVYGHDEADVLNRFIELASKFLQKKKSIRFAGHNIREFDIPYLCRRMVINQISLPPFLQIHGAKPWEVNMVDTLQWWKFGDYKNYTSLHLLAGVLGIATSKDDIDGSMVQEVYYKEKNLQRIVEYCQKDVVVVAQVIRRFSNLPLIESEGIVVVD